VLRLTSCPIDAGGMVATLKVKTRREIVEKV
jgi:hypothetical protein